MGEAYWCYFSVYGLSIHPHLPGKLFADTLDYKIKIFYKLRFLHELTVTELID